MNQEFTTSKLNLSERFNTAGGGQWSKSGGGSWSNSVGGPWSSSWGGKLSSSGGTRPAEDVNVGLSGCGRFVVEAFIIILSVITCVGWLEDADMNMEIEESIPVVSSGVGPGKPVDIAAVVRFCFVVEFNFYFCCRDNYFVYFYHLFVV